LGVARASASRSRLSASRLSQSISSSLTTTTASFLLGVCSFLLGVWGTGACVGVREAEESAGAGEWGWALEGVCSALPVGRMRRLGVAGSPIRGPGDAPNAWPLEGVLGVEASSSAHLKNLQRAGSSRARGQV
jgi:hypothetical protein